MLASQSEMTNTTTGPTEPSYKSLAFVVHGIGEQAKGSTLKHVVEGFRPLLQQRLGIEDVVVKATPLDDSGAAEVTFDFHHGETDQKTHYELRFVEVWWAKAFAPPSLGPLLIGGIRAFWQWYRNHGMPPPMGSEQVPQSRSIFAAVLDGLNFVRWLFIEAVGALFFNSLALVVATLLLLPSLLLTVINPLLAKVGWWTPVLQSIHGAMVSRVAKDQPMIVQSAIIVLSPLLLLLALLLWFIEAVMPVLALKSPVKDVHRFLVNRLTNHFGDMWSYLYRNWEASQIRARFEDVFKQELCDVIESFEKPDRQPCEKPARDVQSVMVIAHSMGTVVTYEALTGEALRDVIEQAFSRENPPSFTLVTVGSALNLSWAVAPPSERPRLWKPLTSQAQWLNLWSEYDPVGDRPLRLPDRAWQGRPIFAMDGYTAPLEQLLVVNQMDLFSDHSAYWNNAEEVVAPLLGRMTGGTLHPPMRIRERHHRVRILANFKAAAWLAGPIAFFAALLEDGLSIDWRWLNKKIDRGWDKVLDAVPDEIEDIAGLLWDVVEDVAAWLWDLIDWLVNWLWDLIDRSVDDGASVEAAAFTAFIALVIGFAIYGSAVKWAWDAWDRTAKYKAPS